MAGRKGSDPLPRGFNSKAQWRYFFVNPKLKRWAHREAHKTQANRGGPKVAFRTLPDHSSMTGRLGVGKATRGVLRVKNRRK